MNVPKHLEEYMFQQYQNSTAEEHPYLCKGGCGYITVDTSGTCLWCQEKAQLRQEMQRKPDDKRRYFCNACDFELTTINVGITRTTCPQCGSPAFFEVSQDTAIAIFCCLKKVCELLPDEQRQQFLGFFGITIDGVK
jgi:hypothetical protein